MNIDSNAVEHLLNQYEAELKAQLQSAKPHTRSTILRKLDAVIAIRLRFRDLVKARGEQS